MVGLTKARPNKGKTERCHAKVVFPDQWDIWHSENHWSNKTMMKRYSEKIIFPSVVNLSSSHLALAIFDRFHGQTTDAILGLKDNNIYYILVPANCTDMFQPLDVAINKPLAAISQFALGDFIIQGMTVKQLYN